MRIDFSVLAVAGAVICSAVSDVSAQTGSGRDDAGRTAPARTGGCVELLDMLVGKVEANYPGYHLEVRGTDRAAAYDDHRAQTRRDATARSAGLDCVALLQSYVAWFEDGHLFVGARPTVSTVEDSARLRASAPRVTWRETDLLSYLDGRGAALDPVEGLWVDPAGIRLAVVREDWYDAADPGPGRATRFVGVVLASMVAHWGAGDVKARLERMPDGSYDVVMYDDVRSAIRPHVFVRGAAGGGRLQRGGLLLHMAPWTWGKLHPVPAGHEGRIDPRDPRAPTARIVDGHTVVFHIPSHVPANAARLHLLVDQFRGALRRADLLIIDLRGNEGGSAGVTNVLLPFLVTSDKRPARYLVDGAPAVIASADNIAMFQRLGWAPPRLAERLMTAEPGTLVPFADPRSDSADAPTAGNGDAAAAVSLERPRNVAILTDAMTVSAAEAFVLSAMRNTSITLFGQPTGSSIDYQTVNTVRFGPTEAGLYLGYPAIVGSDRLPAGGVRPTGIVPDVLIDAGNPDPIRFIIEHYNAGSVGQTRAR